MKPFPSGRATHFEAGLQYVRCSLFSITLLTLMAWARHASAVVVSMRRWGIVDLPPRRRSWRITPSLLLQWLLPHLTAQTSLTHSPSDCINRCFQGETFNHSLWDQIEVCMVCVPRSTCVHVDTAMLYFLCPRCVFGLNKALGMAEFVFFPSQVPCFSAASQARSRRCFKSSAPLLPTC